jgi:hypothetical protein
MAQCLEHARPVMRRRAGLNTNDAPRQLLEERQHLAALQLAANDYVALRVDAMDLKNRLRDVETDCRDSCMLGSLKSWSPHRRPLQWHSCAGGGAVRSIKCRLLRSYLKTHPTNHCARMFQRRTKYAHAAEKTSLLGWPLVRSKSYY